MDKNKALEILIKAAEISQLKGAFTLQDAKVVCEAVECFKSEEKSTENNSTEEKKDEQRPEEVIPAK